jgi:SAM-dependent methyltransferase
MSFEGSVNPGPVLSITSLKAEERLMLQERTIPGQHAALLPIVKTLGAASPSSAILDLGCGTGAWLKRLHDAGYRDLWGVDRDGAGFGAGDIAHFINAELDALGSVLKPGVNFGLVTIIEVIEHVANPLNLIETAAGLLTPGGWMLITSPNIYSLRARLRFLFGRGIPFFERAGSPMSVEPDHLHPVVVEAYQRRIFEPLSLSLVRTWTYPESSGHGSRWFARLVTQIVGLVLRDDLPGDTLCLLLRKQER